MPTEKEKMVAGEPYDPTDPELVADRKRARAIAQKYNRTDPDETDRRSELLSSLLGSLGDRCAIEPPLRCDYGYNIHVGENCFANFGCVLLDVCRIEFGPNCKVGPGVHVYTATHPTDPSERATGREYGRAVSVGSNTWIGGRAVICPGVDIGANTVIAAGSIVTDDVPDGVLVRGNPAAVVRDVG